MTKEQATNYGRKMAIDYSIECVVVEINLASEKGPIYSTCGLEVFPKLFPNAKIVTHIDANGATADAA